MVVHKRKRIGNRVRTLSGSLSGKRFYGFLPNLATIASLCLGVSSIRMAIFERWETAVALILVAAILDGMDGRLARMLGSTSRFGAQLDSFADFVSFGVAPAFIMYFFSLRNADGMGWGVALIFIVCMALRLARFNAQAEEETPQPHCLRSLFFVGVPAPAAGALCLTPLMLWFDQQWLFLREPMFASIIMLVVSVLMVSRIPTFAFKTIRVTQNVMISLMVSAAVTIAGLLSAPWRTLSLICFLYLLMMPFSIWKHRKLIKASAILADE